LKTALDFGFGFDLGYDRELLADQIEIGRLYE
jgi:hypothetical protein